MLKSYWKIAWRNITGHKTFTFINVLGLALGICFCLVIFLVAYFEFSFDRWHPDRERIYHLGYHMSVGSGVDESWNMSRVMPALPEAIRRELTGVEAVTGFYEFWQPKVKVADKTAASGYTEFPAPERGSWSETLISSPDYFSIFQYKWLAGSPASFLQPFQVVLAASRAKQYWGNIPAAAMVGKELICDDSIHLFVSGIVEDWKGNTDFATSAIVSFSTIQNCGLRYRFSTDSWVGVRGKPELWSFVKLARGIDPGQFKARLDGLVKRHTPPGADVRKILLQSLSDVHFDNTYSHDDIRNAYKPTLYGVIAIAVFVLLLAVINFINLSTAQSIRRAKEVGIRKVMGSRRTGLTLQFLTETSFVVLFSVILAACLVKPVLGVFRDFIPSGVVFTPDLPVLLFLLGIMVVTTLLAGYYPARVLSSYLPVICLKGNAAYEGSQGWSLRRGLIVFQFTISLVFIICTLVVSNQVRYMLTTDYGFKSDAIVTVATNWRDSLRKVQVFRDKLSQVPGIESIVRESGPPIGWGHWYMPFVYKGASEVKVNEVTAGDESYVPFYNMHITAGRNIHHTDSMREVLVNETAVHSFGFSKPEQVLGKFLYVQVNGVERSFPIVGVVADYHTESFRSPIHSLVITHWPEQEIYLGVKLAMTGKGAGEAHKILEAMERVFESVYPDRDLNYVFMDESIRSMYEDEQKISLLVRSAMLVTIFISCMGLFGVALFSAYKRTREIGIRKVLGASVGNIVFLLTREFVLLVMLAIVIAAPVAWWSMNHWLNSFAYRIRPGFPLFATAAAGSILIALCTVSFQAIRAARANPAENLRAE